MRNTQSGHPLDLRRGPRNYTLTKEVCQIQIDHDKNDDVDERNEVQDQPPTGSANDLEQYVSCCRRGGCWPIPAPSRVRRCVCMLRLGSRLPATTHARSRSLRWIADHRPHEQSFRLHRSRRSPDDITLDEPGLESPSIRLAPHIVISAPSTGPSPPLPPTPARPG